MAVTKAQVIDAVSKQGVLSRKDAREAVEKLMRVIKETLAGEEDLLVSGFGKFHVMRKRARRGRNPQTKKAIKLRARRVVVFRTSGILRRKINGQEADTAAVADFDSGDKTRSKRGRKTDKK